MPVKKGSFLISGLHLEQGLFSRCVILLCDHSPRGSFGIIINKPLKIDHPEKILDLDTTLNPHIKILSGGNLQPGQIMMLHSNDLTAQNTLSVCDGVFLGGSIEFLEQQMALTEGDPIRLCFGYCAWGPGQLEQEVLSGAWFMHPASQEYVFHIEPSQIWASLLKSMGGKYATLAMIPEDLSLN
jgi:putative transcriptional regulator